MQHGSVLIFQHVAQYLILAAFLLGVAIVQRRTPDTNGGYLYGKHVNDDRAEK